MEAITEPTKQKSGVRVTVGRLRLTEGADLIDAYLAANPRYRRGAVIDEITDRVTAQVEREIAARAKAATRIAIADALRVLWQAPAVAKEA